MALFTERRVGENRSQIPASGDRRRRQSFAERVNPIVEETYWRENYSSRPYVSGAGYDQFGPAYAYGVNSYSRYAGRDFDDVESDLSRDWDSARGTSSLTWERAKHATRDAWDRLSNRVEHVGSRNEKHLGQIKRHVQIIIAER